MDMMNLATEAVNRLFKKALSGQKTFGVDIAFKLD